MLSHCILPDDGRGKSFDSHQPSNPNTKNISICPQMTNHTKARDIHATPAAVAEGCYRHDIVMPRANLIDADASPVSFLALQLGVQHQTSEKQNKNKNQVWKDTTEKLKLKGLACDTPTTTVDISTTKNTFSLLFKKKITTTWAPDRKGEVETLPTDSNKVSILFSFSIFSLFLRVLPSDTQYFSIPYLRTPKQNRSHVSPLVLLYMLLLVIFRTPACLA